MWKNIEVIDNEEKSPKYYTFMAIPHSNGKVFRVRIPYIFIRTVAALAVISLLAVVIIISNYLETLKDVSELEELRATNRELEEKVEDLNERAMSLQEKVTGLQKLEKNIREMMNLGEAQVEDSMALAAYQLSRGMARERGDLTLIQTGRGGSHPGSILGFPVLAMDNCQRENVSIQEVESLTNLLEIQIESLDEKINKLNADVTDWKAYMDAKPSIWPVSGKISSTYGYRKSPFGRYTEFHEGIDIAANYGSSIKASGAGVVELASYKGGYGLCVIINHGYGFKTVYGHNSRVSVKVGQRVEKGQVIGYVGSTGRSTGPHLHYEVHLNGHTVDPVKYMK